MVPKERGTDGGSERAAGRDAEHSERQERVCKRVLPPRWRIEKFKTKFFSESLILAQNERW